MNIIFGIISKLRKTIFPTKHEKIVSNFIADNKKFNLRYNYDLNENSIIIDLGGYDGQWSSDIFSRFQSKLIIFEPVKSFFLVLKERYKLNKKIEVYNLGAGSSDREESIYLAEDGSSVFLKGRNREIIKIIDIIQFLTKNKIYQIDLIKINIEGGEYEVIDALIKSGYINKIKNIQIQFHNTFPGAKKKMEEIQNYLSVTHKLSYQYTFVWENWVKK